MSHTKSKGDPAGSPKVPPLTPGKKFVFYLVALALPFLVLAILEAGLRLGGYGYPTTFFLEQKIGGENFLVENPRFGLQFFPQGMARSPAPVVMKARKDPGTVRIFILGESAALGDPKPAYGFGRFLEVLLQARYPEKRIEVVCVAMTAINSHVVLPIARECANYGGDLWIVYMGNNEAIGPFGALGVWGRPAPPLPLIRANLAVKRTRVAQLFESGLRRWFRPESGAWRGTGAFSGKAIAPDDPVRDRLESHYNANLRDIIEIGQGSGAKVLISSVGGNLKDCSPYASLHSVKFDSTVSQEWNRHYQAGQKFQVGGNHSEALLEYEKAARIDSLFAELQFRMGDIHLAGTNVGSAISRFQAALDADALPLRTPAVRNASMRAIAASRSAHYFDLANELRRTNSIPGHELFWDHVHFTFEANYRVALGLAEKAVEALGQKLTDSSSSGWLSFEECSRGLGLTAFNRYLTTELMLMRLAEGPYTNQTSNPRTVRWLSETLDRYRADLRRASADTLTAVYTNAIAARPHDFYLVQNYAEFLELTSDLKGAVGAWKQVQKLLPHHPIAFFHAGRLLLRQKNPADAEGQLREALSRRSDFIEARVELGQALAKQSRHAEAIEQFKNALQVNPANDTAHLGLANSLAASGRREDGLRQLQTALKTNPRNWEAHYLLGVELAMKGRIGEAEVHFRRTIELRPEFPLAHLNLGVALARQNRLQEAVGAFERTLQLDPGNASAKGQLEMARQLLERSQNAPSR